MFRRMLSLALTLLLTFAIVLTAFAVEGSDAEPAHAVIRFDTTTTGWEGFRYVGFHIWGVGDKAFYDWGGKAQCGYDLGDGVWAYNLAEKGIELDPDKQYAVIFYTDLGQQTDSLLFDTTCFGDVACADPSQILESPEDSQKAKLPVYWSRQNPAVNGYGRKTAVPGTATIRGDADSSGAVTIMDATRIQRWLAKVVSDDGIDLVAADADGNRSVTIMDATRIQRWLAKLCGMDGGPYHSGSQPATEPNQLIIIGGEGYELPVLQ